jgi:hypothetical protein
MRNRNSFTRDVAVGLLLLVGGSVALNAQEASAPSAPAPSPGKTPLYPRVNLSPIYDVDPSWPKKPADFVWKAMPGIAVDADDNIWIFTRSTPPVQIYRPDGTFVRAWGGDFIGTAHHIKIGRDGTVWLTDIKRHVVRQCTPDGQVLRTLGTLDEPGDDEAHFDKPTDVVVTPAGDIFVADGYGNNRIMHFDKDGKFVKQWGQLGVGPGDFSLPHAITVDSRGRLLIADRNNARIQIYSQDGTLLDSWANVIVPWGFWNTADDTMIWVCGSTPQPWAVDKKYPLAPLGCPPKDQVLMRFDLDGRVRQTWSVPKGEDDHEQPGDLNWVHALAVDSQGNIYAGDIIGKRAQKFAVRKP